MVWSLFYVINKWSGVEMAKAATYARHSCGCAELHKSASPPPPRTEKEAAMAMEETSKMTGRKKGGLRTMPFIFGKRVY
jgi:hypothetical protein